MTETYFVFPWAIPPEVVMIDAILRRFHPNAAVTYLTRAENEPISIQVDFVDVPEIAQDWTFKAHNAIREYFRENQDVQVKAIFAGHPQIKGKFE